MMRHDTAYVATVRENGAIVHESRALPSQKQAWSSLAVWALVFDGYRGDGPATAQLREYARTGGVSDATITSHSSATGRTRSYSVTSYTLGSTGKLGDTYA